MRKKLLTIFALIIAAGVGITIPLIPKKAPAPAVPLNSLCAKHNHDIDLVCIMNGEAVIGRIYK